MKTRPLMPGELDRAMQEMHEKAISDMPTGAHMILDERRRQIEKEGWTSEHDDVHRLGELSQAAHVYAEVASAQARGASSEEFPADMMVAEGDWPFEECWWKPSPDPIRNLVKAGALVAAEIDRLQRLPLLPKS